MCGVQPGRERSGLPRPNRRGAGVDRGRPRRRNPAEDEENGEGRRNDASATSKEVMTQDVLPWGIWGHPRG